MTKTILITGANRGIGFATALRFAQQSNHVIIGARTADKASAAVAALIDKGIKADLLDSVEIDLNHPETAISAASTIAKTHPELSVLLNNAGIAGDMDKSPLDNTAADYQETINVNLLGTLAVTQAFLPIIQKNAGQIVNITGVGTAALFYHPGPYNASKAAMNSAMESLAAEFEVKKIPVQIYGIFPGGVTTDINNNREAPYMRTKDQAAELIQSTIDDDKAHNGQVIGPDGQVMSDIVRSM